MSTASSAVAVVATSAARIDRRALSQAWYSALHLAETAPPRGRGATSSAAPTARGQAVRAVQIRAGSSPDGGRPGAPAKAPVAARRATPPPFAEERRAARTALAQRIERAVARGSAACCTTSSAAVATAGGRVHVVVRTQGGVTRIVALCPPALQAPVERALAHARYALGARGARLGAR